MEEEGQEEEHVPFYIRRPEECISQEQCLGRCRDLLPVHYLEGACGPSQGHLCETRCQVMLRGINFV